MILLLDVGNNRIKWGILQDGKLTTTGATPHISGNIQSLVDNEWRDFPKPDRVVVSNVIGKGFSGQFDDLAKLMWGINVEYVVPFRSAFGVINAYHDPDRLGTDRWAALIAARHHFKGALCVVDCGTALTLDILAENDQHLGGLIIPGFSMMQSALLERTAGIKSNKGSLPHNSLALLPSDTREAVYAGGLYATIAVIDRVADDLSNTLGTEISGVITGGDAPLIKALLRKKYTHEPHLVLKGLAIIAGSDS